MMTLNIPGRPVPYTRARHGGRRVYNTSKYNAWLNEVALYSRLAHDGDMMRGGVALGLDIAVEDGRHGDLSNYQKAIEDGAQRAQAIFKDDKQITAVCGVMRLDRECPGVTAHFAPVSLTIAWTMYHALRIFEREARG